MEKHLLYGNEAIARGAYEAGVRVCSAYPGTPSTEVFENLTKYGDDLYCEWAPNEKVAVEVAYGASIAGVRSLAAMKQLESDKKLEAKMMEKRKIFPLMTFTDRQKQ